MNDLRELKQYVGAHARGQRIGDYAAVLERIRHDEDGPGSWVGEWAAEGERLGRAGRHLEACRHFIMARFPFVDGPARLAALDLSLASFERWRLETRQDIHRLEVDLKGGRVVCWHSGLSPTDRRPLLLLMGGNVSVKEQWAPALRIFRRLGFAAMVTDMPSCGENTLPYDADSPGMISGLLDAVEDRARVRETYALAMSFSGHLALRCASADPRIRGVLTVGAPVNGFFTDASWRPRIPRVTIDTLVHMTGVEEPDLFAELGGWALSGEELAALDIPVAYVASRRDEIIPPEDPALLLRRVRRLRLLEHDDVHGAPDHVVETQLFTARSLLAMRGGALPQRAALAVLARLARLRSRSG
ncbi:alpha/beta hydrolase [Streptomyces sp. NRRL S-350]|uniref:alpha/beta hydrolase n=1 Tax=Streptomyces sp. NRRL S-350 TaxID=1463902 RepID=UPI0004BE97DF|nr:alpha/beta hydrolase [Streptomyces sp. NRRL S-350]